MNCLAPILVLVFLFSGSAMAEPTTLQEALASRVADSGKRIPKETQEIMKRSIDDLAKSHLLRSVPKGTVFPDHELLDPSGKKRSLYSSIGKRKAVVTFYRGGWCPYCNLQLHYYQKSLEKIQSAGGTLVAISPETPDSSLTTIEKNELKFSVLSDSGNDFARKLGIVFALPDALKEVYTKFGINLQESQGNDKWELPLAATFVLDEDRKVIYRFVDADYKKRAPIDDVIAALNQS